MYWCPSPVCPTVSFLMCFPVPESNVKYINLHNIVSTTVFVLTQTSLCGFILFIVSHIYIYVDLYCVSFLLCVNASP